MKEDIKFKEVFIIFCNKRIEKLGLNSTEAEYLISSAMNVYKNIMKGSIWPAPLFETMLLEDVWLSHLMSTEMNEYYRVYFWRPYYMAPNGVMLESEIKECIKFGFEFCDASDYAYYDWDSYWSYDRKGCETEEYYWRTYEVKEYKGAIHTPIY